MLHNTEYLTTRGHTFSFSGWPPGGTPLELFDRADYLTCLHACMFAASTRDVIEDDALLHELVHLAAGVPICTHNTLAGLRREVAELQMSVRVGRVSMAARKQGCAWCALKRKWRLIWIRK